MLLGRGRGNSRAKFTPVGFIPGLPVDLGEAPDHDRFDSAPIGRRALPPPADSSPRLVEGKPTASSQIICLTGLFV